MTDTGGVTVDNEESSVDLASIFKNLNGMGFVHISCGKDAKGRDYWAYLYIPFDKAEQFAHVLQRGEPVNLTQQGKIITSGFGEFPPDYIQEYMTLKYGIDHKALDRTMDAAEELFKAAEKEVQKIREKTGNPKIPEGKLL